MLDRLEDLVCDVVDRVLKSPFADLVKDLHPVSKLLCDIKFKYMCGSNVDSKQGLIYAYINFLLNS